MDLTCDVPRSPYEKLGGIVFLPRSIDKGRAELAGTLGEYLARHGRSGRLFKFLGISAKTSSKHCATVRRTSRCGPGSRTI